MKKILALMLSIIFIDNVFAMDMPAEHTDSDKFVYADVIVRPNSFEETSFEESAECYKALENARVVTTEEEKVKLLKFAFYGPEYVNVGWHEPILIRRDFADFVETNIRVFLGLLDKKIGTYPLLDLCKEHGIDFSFIYKNAVFAYSPALGLGSVLSQSNDLQKKKEAIFWFLVVAQANSNHLADASRVENEIWVRR